MVLLLHYVRRSGAVTASYCFSSLRPCVLLSSVKTRPGSISQPHKFYLSPGTSLSHLLLHFWTFSTQRREDQKRSQNIAESKHFKLKNSRFRAPPLVPLKVPVSFRS